MSALMGGLPGCGMPSAAVLAAAPAPSTAVRSDHFQAVASHGTVAVAAGGAGTLMRSADAGRSWQRLALDARVSIIDLVACPDGSFHGIDFYGKAWHGSTDAATWRASDLGADFTPLAITCAPDGRLWIVGSHTTIASSADGGQRWQVTTQNEDAMLRAVQFVDARTGFIVGEFGRVLRTDDGGQTWRSPGPLGDDFYPYAMHFEDARSGWVSGLAGTVVRTTDGGLNWAPEENASGRSIYALLRQTGRLYGVGDAGQLLRRDEGAWHAVGRAVEGALLLNGAARAGEAAVVVTGPAGVLATVQVNDEGAHR